MKDWIKEILIGTISLAIGAVAIVYWLGDVINVVKGLIGPALLLLGLIFFWIGVEDKKLEKELKDVEKELDEEKEEKEEEEKVEKSETGDEGEKKGSRKK